MTEHRCPGAGEIFSSFTQKQKKERQAELRPHGSVVKLECKGLLSTVLLSIKGVSLANIECWKVLWV